MTREEPKFFTDIHDFITLFYVILRHKSSEWLQVSIESDWYAIDLAMRDFAFFIYLLIFVMNYERV